MKQKSCESCVFQGCVEPCLNCGKEKHHWIRNEREQCVYQTRKYRCKYGRMCREAKEAKAPKFDGTNECSYAVRFFDKNWEPSKE